MQTSDFHFDYPPELIAQMPSKKRDESRLLVLERSTYKIEHRQFPELPAFLRAGDVLVLNNSRVIPARLHGVNAKTGGKFEILLLEENGVNDWWAMLRPGKNARVGTQINLSKTIGDLAKISAMVMEVNPEGHRRLSFTGTKNLRQDLDSLGEMPLPPYIERKVESPEDRERYQTVFAQAGGSVAAPTAGLHFTPELLEKIRAHGVIICFVTLHVGVGTFLPVKAEMPAAHKMHAEHFEIGEETVRIMNEAKNAGNRILAVGTTTARVLESVAQKDGKINVHKGKTDIFIYPPFQFKMVDGLLTNFHLPCSTLLMLVSAFAASGEMRGREMILSAYAEAIRRQYRLFSYGDAMLIL